MNPLKGSGFTASDSRNYSIYRLEIVLLLDYLKSFGMRPDRVQLVVQMPVLYDKILRRVRRHQDPLLVQPSKRNLHTLERCDGHNARM